MVKIKLKARVPSRGKSVQGTKRPMKGPKKAPPQKKALPQQQPPQQRRESSSSLSSPANLSDDGGYSAVEDVSDSDDDDEEHVYAAEELHILANEWSHKRGATRSSPRPNANPQDDKADDADDDDSGDEESSQQRGSGDMDFENAIDDDDSSVLSDSESWPGCSGEDEQAPYPPPNNIPAEHPGTSVERHVRFAGLPESDSDSDETDSDQDGFFPDIFTEQDSLDPNFRREIERDGQHDSDSSFSYWDLTGAPDFDRFSDSEASEEPTRGTNIGGGLFSFSDTYLDMTPEADVFFSTLPQIGHPTNMDSATPPVMPDVPLGDDEVDDDEEEEEEEEEEESVGYESDGETTDEEPEPARIRLKKHIQSRRASAASSDNEPGQDIGTPAAQRRRHPNKTPKPICLINPHTHKMMIFTPGRTRPVTLSPSRFPTDFLSMEMPSQSSPLKASHDMRQWPVGNLFQSFSNVLQLPWPQSSMRGPASESSSIPDDEEEDPEEKNLDINDFIRFEEGDSDHLEQADDDADEGNPGNPDTPSRRPAEATSAAGDGTPTSFQTMINHFDQRPNSVGAFRLNQTQQKLILNGEATQESLAFANPLFNGALRGIKHGSLNGAATPLTPERRHKKASAKSPAEAVALKKRKASGMVADHSSHAHKKHRSISDVSSMQI